MKGDLARDGPVDGERELGRRRRHAVGVGRRVARSDLEGEGPLARALLADEGVDGVQIFGWAAVETVAHGLRRVGHHVRLQRADVDQMLRRQLAPRRQRGRTLQWQRRERQRLLNTIKTHSVKTSP